MKKFYIAPKMEICAFNDGSNVFTDIITASGEVDNGFYGNEWDIFSEG